MTLENPEFLDAYAATYGFRLGIPANVQITPDGRRVLFLRSGPRSFVRSLYEQDVETGTERVLLTAERVLDGADEELSAEERARRERLRLSARGITSYELSSDGARVLVPLSGRLFVVELGDGSVREVGASDAYAEDPHLSPDGRWVAFVREGELQVVDLEDAGRVRALSTGANDGVSHGLAEFIAQEEMGRYRGFWWSPESDRLVYQRTTTTDVERLRIVDPMDPSVEPHVSAYPRAGRANAVVELGVVPVRGGPTRWIEWDRERYPYLATVRWTSPGPLTIVVQDRRQREEQVLVVDPRTGQATVAHTERDDAWINLEQELPRWVRGGAGAVGAGAVGADADGAPAEALQLLWWTERDGWPVLELRTRDGAHVRSLTPPALGLRSFLHADAEHVWVAASPEPTEQHVYRVPLAGGDPVQLTDEPGVHSLTVRGSTSVVTSHTELGVTHRVIDGEREAGQIRSEAETPPFVPAPEFVEVGDRSLRALVLRPRDFDPARHYPVLVSVYGGPLHQSVMRTPHRYLLQQWYADQGYIVVATDGRGTPGRGRVWERALAGDVITAPLEDQVSALRGLADRFPEMDTSRVGIWGWSFGGYFSAMAVMREGGTFHAGVSGAPVADWRDYDTHYTERYLGLPDDEGGAYDRSSVLSYAAELERPLLIIHGTADDNVYFTHAIKMSDALFRAGREHEFLPLSGFTHMVTDPAVTRGLHGRILAFFARHLRAAH